MKCCAIITVDENFFWDVCFVSFDEEKIKNKFNSIVEGILSQKVEVDDEDSDYVIFEDGREVWVVCKDGENEKCDDCFVVFGETGEGFVLEGIYSNEDDAVNKINQIKDEYKNAGCWLHKEYNDMIVFENDDVFKIKRIKLNKGECNE